MTSRIPNPKKAKDALEFLVEVVTPAQRAAITKVIEFEQDSLFLGTEDGLLEWPSDRAHAYREHQRGVFKGLELALNHITNIKYIQQRVLDLENKMKNEGSPDEYAG